MKEFRLDKNIWYSNFSIHIFTLFYICKQLSWNTHVSGGFEKKKKKTAPA